MNAQEYVSEQQIQYMLMKEAESFNLVEQELTQEMNHWKKEAMISQQFRGEIWLKVRCLSKSSEQPWTLRVPLQQVATPCCKNGLKINRRNPSTP